jgi:hypothetical protein
MKFCGKYCVKLIIGGHRNFYLIFIEFPTPKIYKFCSLAGQIQKTPKICIKKRMKTSKEDKGRSNTAEPQYTEIRHSHQHNFHDIESEAQKAIRLEKTVFFFWKNNRVMSTKRIKSGTTC